MNFDLHSHRTQLILTAVAASAVTAGLLSAYQQHTRLQKRKSLNDEVLRSLAASDEKGKGKACTHFADAPLDSESEDHSPQSFDDDNYCFQMAVEASKDAPALAPGETQGSTSASHIIALSPTPSPEPPAVHVVRTVNDQHLDTRSNLSQPFWQERRQMEVLRPSVPRALRDYNSPLYLPESVVPSHVPTPLEIGCVPTPPISRHGSPAPATSAGAVVPSRRGWECTESFDSAFLPLGSPPMADVPRINIPLPQLRRPTPVP